MYHPSASTTVFFFFLYIFKKNILREQTYFLTSILNALAARIQINTNTNVPYFCRNRIYSKFLLCQLCCWVWVLFCFLIVHILSQDRPCLKGWLPEATCLEPHGYPMCKAHAMQQCCKYAISSRKPSGFLGPRPDALELRSKVVLATLTSWAMLQISTVHTQFWCN